MHIKKNKEFSFEKHLKQHKESISKKEMERYSKEQYIWGYTEEENKSNLDFDELNSKISIYKNIINKYINTLNKIKNSGKDKLEILNYIYYNPFLIFSFFIF